MENKTSKSGFHCHSVVSVGGEANATRGAGGLGNGGLVRMVSRGIFRGKKQKCESPEGQRLIVNARDKVEVARWGQKGRQDPAMLKVRVFLQ